ncbi:hypothetical protein SAMN05880561_101241 [Rhizobium sp. RU33A]|nr:hypothetical protein SAMN05880561_101241 [Rhizobium sp. RU33A]
MTFANPSAKSTKPRFFIPAHFHALTLIPSRPRIHLTMRCQARRGRRRGGVLSQAQIPGPLQRSPSGRGGGSDGGQPDAGRLQPPIGRTCLRGTQTRRQCCHEHPGSGANKTAGMQAEVDDQSFIPRARVPVGMVHHPAGTSRATGQALADIPSGGLCQSRTLRPVILDPRVKPEDDEDRRRLARETHAAGIDAERGAGRSHIKLLRQVASGASSETSFSLSGGSDPDRRRSLGFLTVKS